MHWGSISKSPSLNQRFSTENAQCNYYVNLSAFFCLLEAWAGGRNLCLKSWQFVSPKMATSKTSIDTQLYHQQFKFNSPSLLSASLLHQSHTVLGKDLALQLLLSPAIYVLLKQDPEGVFSCRPPQTQPRWQKSRISSASTEHGLRIKDWMQLSSTSPAWTIN